MLTVPRIVIHSDVVNLTKEDLQAICSDLNLDTVGHNVELAQRIWHTVSENADLMNQALGERITKIQCGKMAVMIIATAKNSVDLIASFRTWCSVIQEAMK